MTYCGLTKLFHGFLYFKVMGLFLKKIGLLNVKVQSFVFKSPVLTFQKSYAFFRWLYALIFKSSYSCSY